MQINRLISKYNFSPSTVARIKYIVIHYTGAIANAESNVRYFAGGDRGASAHYFVGYNGEIWQSVEDGNIAWHCGAKQYRHHECRNANSIGIELCTKTTGSISKADEKWYFEDATVDSAVELVKELMLKYHVPDDRVLRHYDVTSKCCPAPYVFNKGKHTWEEFKARIMSKSITKKESDDSAVIWSFLTETAGFNEFGAAGLMGNLYAESGLKPTNLQNSFEKKLGMTDQQYTDAVDNGSYLRWEFFNDKAGYGLAQWTYWTRKKALYEHVKGIGASIGDLKGQLSFLLSEIKGNYGTLYSKLQNADSVRTASDAVLHEFERPADQSEAVEKKRAEYGQTFYDIYASEKTSRMDPPFLVKVTAEDLNIRCGPGTDHSKTGKYTGPGTFTIVDISSGPGSKTGWGKLKSGLGWISLDYAEIVQK